MQSISSNITISINDHKILIRKRNSFGGKCCEKIARKVRSKSGKNWQHIGKNWAKNRDALKSSLMGNSRVCVTKDHENWADSVSQTSGTTLCKLCKYFKFWRILQLTAFCQDLQRYLCNSSLRAQIQGTDIKNAKNLVQLLIFCEATFGQPI